VKKFPLSQRGWRQRRLGVVLPIEEDPDSAGLYLKRHAASFFDHATVPDNPRAVGAAPFCKGELLATASTVQFFHSSPLPVGARGAEPLMNTQASPDVTSHVSRQKLAIASWWGGHSSRLKAPAGWKACPTLAGA